MVLGGAKYQGFLSDPLFYRQALGPCDIRVIPSTVFFQEPRLCTKNSKIEYVIESRFRKVPRSGSNSGLLLPAELHQPLVHLHN